VSLARAYPGPETIEVLEAARGAATSVPGLAAGHLLAVESLGAGCRWHLAGHSFGACVALELAARAERSGWRPATIALVTPLLRLGGELDAAEREAAAARLRAADRLQARLRGDDMDGADVGRDLAHLDLDPALMRSGSGFVASLLARAASALRAYLDARPPRIAAPVHLFVGADAGSPVEPVERRLRELTGGVTVHELPFAPADVLRQPCAAEVARRLACLAAA
jgi:alpha-beta hydrolase superfamily lysophospholipase